MKHAFGQNPPKGLWFATLRIEELRGSFEARLHDSKGEEEKGKSPEPPLPHVPALCLLLGQGPGGPAPHPTSSHNLPTAPRDQTAWTLTTKSRPLQSTSAGTPL